MSGTQVTGLCPWCGVHVSAQVAILPALVPPLRSASSAPPRLPRRSMEVHPLCQPPFRSTICACCLQRLTGLCPWCGVHVGAHRWQSCQPWSPPYQVRSASSAPPRLPRRSMEVHPLCQPLSRSTICTCCLQRDHQLSRLPALLLTWNPPLRCRCAQGRPSQAEEHSRPCLRFVRVHLPGHRIVSLVRRARERADGVLLPTLVPPLRSSASPPLGLPQQSSNARPLCYSLTCKLICM